MYIYIYIYILYVYIHTHIEQNRVPPHARASVKLKSEIPRCEAHHLLPKQCDAWSWKSDVGKGGGENMPNVARCNSIDRFSSFCCCAGSRHLPAVDPLVLTFFALATDFLNQEQVFEALRSSQAISAMREGPSVCTRMSEKWAAYRLWTDVLKRLFFQNSIVLSVSQ